jgi:hypothetical protein
MHTQRRRRPTSVRPTLEPCESKVLLSAGALSLQAASPTGAAAAVTVASSGLLPSWIPQLIPTISVSIGNILGAQLGVGPGLQ